MRERRQREVMMNMRVLGLLAAQEFPAGGQVEEQLAHFERGAVWSAGFLHLDYLAAMNDDLGGGRRIAVAFACGDAEAADTGDAGQGFAAKAHGRDGAKVFSSLNLARGVAFEAEQGIVAVHA